MQCCYDSGLTRSMSILAGVEPELDSTNVPGRVPSTLALLKYAKHLLNMQIHESADILISFLLSINQQTREVDQTECLALYGDALRGLKENSRAIAYYRKALHTARSNRSEGRKVHSTWRGTETSIIFKIALCLEELGDWESSIKELQAVPRSSRSATINNFLGRLYHRLGRRNRSVEAYKACLKQQPMAIGAAIALASAGVPYDDIVDLAPSVYGSCHSACEPETLLSDSPSRENFAPCAQSAHLATPNTVLTRQSVFEGIGGSVHGTISSSRTAPLRDWVAWERPETPSNPPSEVLDTHHVPMDDACTVDTMHYSSKANGPCNNFPFSLHSSRKRRFLYLPAVQSTEMESFGPQPLDLRNLTAVGAADTPPTLSSDTQHSTASLWCSPSCRSPAGHSNDTPQDTSGGMPHEPPKKVGRTWPVCREGGDSDCLCNPCIPPRVLWCELLVRANCALRRADNAAAVQHFTDITEMFPCEIHALLGAASALVASGDDIGALSMWQRARAVDCMNVRGMDAFARLLLEVGNSRELQSLSQDMLCVDPQLPEVWAVTACFWLLHSDWDRALEVVERGLKFRPDHTGLHLAKGRCLLHKKDSEGALAEFRAVLRSSNDPVAFNGAVHACLMLRRFSEARFHAQAALKLLPNSASAEYLCGCVSTQTPDAPVEEAEKHMRRVLKLDPAHKEAALFVVNMLQQRQAWHEAIAILKEQLVLRPTDALHVRLGQVFGAAGCLAEAADEFQAALGLNPGNRVALEALEEIGTKQGGNCEPDGSSLPEQMVAPDFLVLDRQGLQWGPSPTVMQPPWPVSEDDGLSMDG